MKNCLKRLLLVTTCLLSSIVCFALDYESFIVDGIGYKILTENTVAVTHHAQTITGEVAPAQSPTLRRTAYVYSYVDITYSGKVVIPATVTYGGIIYSVTTIEASCFRECSSLTSITIPNTVTKVDKSAFTSCRGLVEFVIEDGSEEIGFNNDTYQGTHAIFSNCAIDSLYLGRNIKMLDNTSGNTDAAGLFPSLNRVAIGDYVTNIPANLFKGKTELTTVHFGKNIASMGYGVFEGCSKLESMDLTSRLTSIPSRTFYYCESLQSVIIPEGITSIESSCFHGSSSLSSITIPNTVTKVDKSAFTSCRGLVEFVIEDGSEEIGFNNDTYQGTHAIFSNCAIDSLYLGRNIKMLNNTSAIGLFKSNLTKLSIGTEVTNLLDNIFSTASNLSKIYPLHENPITFNKNVFPNAVYSNVTLLVPGGTVKKYRATAAWNEFANIVPTAIGVTMTATAGGSIRLGDERVSNGTRLLQVKPNSVLTFEITPEETHFLTSVTMNGEDVTAQVANGRLTPSDLSEDLEIEATFTAKQFYSVTATASGGGTATAGSGSVMWGKSTTITLTANEGHQLKSVTVNNIDKTNDVEDGVLTLDNIQASQAVVATFQKQRFAVTASECENGSISLSATEVEWDDDVTVTFTPAAHYEVAAVSVNGEDRTAQLIGNQLTIENIRQATTVGATFRLQTFVVRETHNAGGSVQLSAGTAPWGSTVTLTITPDDEHLLESVSVNGIDVTGSVTDSEYAIRVEDATVVTVTFAAKPYYSVTATASGGGTATVGSGSVMWGRGTTVTLTPDECYELKSVTVNGEDVTDEVVAGRLTLEDIREDQRVEATFGIITETITMATSSGAPREMKGYSSERGLDFTNVTDVKAYIASFFTKDHTTYLTRIYVVPPHTGVVLRTTSPGVTVDVPTTSEDVYIANLLMSAVNNVTVKPTETIDGVDYRNLMVGMLNGTNKMGFVEFSSTIVRSNNCYLRVPTAFYNSAVSARSMGGLNIVFDDEVETTDIDAIEEYPYEEDNNVYDLLGRKVTSTRKGLVIKNGKLIYVKP